MVHQTDFESALGEDKWMPSDKYPGRFAASLINGYRVPHTTAMFSTSAVGFTLRPADLNAPAAIRCAYAQDGNSMGADNEGCADVAWEFPEPKFQQMMEKHACCPVGPWKGCAPERADSADRWGCQYNEIVLNAHVWVDHLPGLIESIFFPTECPVGYSEGTEADAMKLRARFLRKFHLQPDDVPLVSFSCQEARAGRAPFKLVPDIVSPI